MPLCTHNYLLSKHNIIALLCDIKDIDKFFNRLNYKLKKFSPKKREDYLRKVFYLLRLRPKLNDEYEKRQEEIKMPFVIELESAPVYQKGEEKGLKKGIEKRSLEIAKSLLSLHDDKTIAEIVGLDIKEIKKLRLQGDL